MIEDLLMTISVGWMHVSVCIYVLDAGWSNHTFDDENNNTL